MASRRNRPSRLGNGRFRPLTAPAPGIGISRSTIPLAICQIGETDFASFHAALSVVIRERRYLAFLDPPPFEMTRAFCLRNIEKGYPQLVVVDETARVVGWCDITPPGREAMAHVGVLGIGLVPRERDNGLGRRLMEAAIEAGWAFG